MGTSSAVIVASAFMGVYVTLKMDPLRAPNTMSSKTLWTSRAACKSKCSYPSRQSAMKAFVRVAKKAKFKNKHVYQCDVCHKYHIGGKR